MNIDFCTNDYLLAWNLLFKPSNTEEVQKLKERLWKNYSKQYIKMEKDNIEILKYSKDFIPDDDTIYNFVFESPIFDKIKKETEKHKQYLSTQWGINQKKIQDNLETLLRFKINDNYHIIVVHPSLNIVEFIRTNPKKNIAWGKNDDTDDGLKALMRIIFTLVKYELGDFQKENREILASILDLAITNELQTRVLGISTYSEGFKSLKLLKKQLYPYWLMYLGADKEELVRYMMRDQSPFDLDKYPVERGLAKIDFYGFIDFCCKNQKYIVRLNDLEMI